MNKNIPAISVIIPMYNTEKYIGECLKSIFAQTFTDYEIIVVDDCSTDNSCAIVEKYSDDRIKLIRRKTNSGNRPGIPRNDAIRFAVGKYITFVDSDDAITNTAFEEMFNIAESFQADVVHSEKFFQVSEEIVTTDKRFLKSASYESDFVDKPTLITENIAERAANLAQHKFSGWSCNQLFNREFLIYHDIKFPPVSHAEDWIFNFFVLMYAKNYVRVPNIFYIYRIRSNSSIHARLSVEGYIHDWAGSVFQFIKILDDFMKKFDIFDKTPELKYALFEEATRLNLNSIIQIYAQIPAAKLDKLVRAELDKLEDTKALTAFLFSRMNLFNVQILRQQQIIKKLQR